MFGDHIAHAMAHERQRDLVPELRGLERERTFGMGVPSSSEMSTAVVDAGGLRKDRRAIVTLISKSRRESGRGIGSKTQTQKPRPKAPPSTKSLTKIVASLHRNAR